MQSAASNVNSGLCLLVLACPKRVTLATAVEAGAQADLRDIVPAVMWGQQAAHVPGMCDAKRARVGGLPMQQFPGQVQMVAPFGGATFGAPVFVAQPVFQQPQGMCMVPPAQLQGAGMMAPMMQQQSIFPAAGGACAPSGGSDLTQSIFAALQSRRREPEPLISEVAALAPAQDQELGSKLIDSLRGLLPEDPGLVDGGDPLQELRRVVQGSPGEGEPQTAQADLPVPTSAPVAAGPPLIPVKEEEAPPEPVPEPAPAAPAQAPAEPPPRPRRIDIIDIDVGRQDPREEDIQSDSDDGVPHRLPPNFGAIPEDLVEERARLREEQRMLQLKATQPCRFGRRCKKRDCPNAHPEGRDIDTAWNPCAFGRRCKRKGCFYDHPEGRIIDEQPEKGMCKFGARCSRPDCLYDHPEGRVPLAGPDPRVCYFCHDSGHIATDCPRNPSSWAFARGEAAPQTTQVILANQPGQKAITGG